MNHDKHFLPLENKHLSYVGLNLTKADLYGVCIDKTDDLYVFVLIFSELFHVLCFTEARRKCGPGEISPDGFEPCRGM